MTHRKSWPRVCVTFGANKKHSKVREKRLMNTKPCSFNPSLGCHSTREDIFLLRLRCRAAEQSKPGCRKTANRMGPRSRSATLTCLKPNSNNLLYAISELATLCELSGQYVGHFLLPPKLFLNLNQRGWQALSAGLHPAAELGREMFTFLHVFPFHVLIHKILFGQTCIQPWLKETGERAQRLAWRAVSLSSAAVGGVPVLGLEGESGLWRAQPHPAGEQKAGEGLGEPVAQWVDAHTLSDDAWKLTTDLQTGSIS